MRYHRRPIQMFLYYQCSVYHCLIRVPYLLVKSAIVDRGLARVHRGVRAVGIRFLSPLKCGLQLTITLFPSPVQD